MKTRYFDPRRLGSVAAGVCALAAWVGAPGCASEGPVATEAASGGAAVPAGASPSGGGAIRPPAADPVTGADAGPSAVGAADAGRDGPASPASCGTAAPPLDGLAIWLRAGEGYTTDGANVTAWADLAGGAPARAPSDIQRPTLVPGGLNGKTTLHFEGAPDDAHQQALQRAVPISGLEEMTIVFVNATPMLWKDDATEWCHYAGCNASADKVPGKRAVSETGCSGTYQHVLWWDGAPNPNKPGSALDWSGVFLTPKQEGVGFRFGNTAETYSDQPCDIVHDTHVEWPRPSSIGARWTATIAVHARLENRLYVDGALAQALPVPGGVEPRIYAGDRLDVGNGFGWVDGHNHGGDVAEVLVYRRALSDDERAAVDRYLDCNLFPSRVAP